MPAQESFTDRLMAELVTRERNERVVMWEMLTAAVGAFLGHNAEIIKRTLRPLRNALAEEVFQTGYTADTLLSSLYARLKEVRTTRHNLERLEKMTV